jgi:hypothetical protein
MLYAFLISVACPYSLTRLGFINAIFGEAYDKLWSSSLCNFFHPFIIFSILVRNIILNICSANFYNLLRYPDISDSIGSSESIVCILQLCFINVNKYFVVGLFCDSVNIGNCIMSYMWIMYQKEFEMYRLEATRSVIRCIFRVYLQELDVVADIQIRFLPSTS